MTRLSELHKSSGVPFITFNGIEVPIKYSEFTDEYQALRNTILMSDLSHYTKVQVEGDEAYDLLESVFTGYLSEVRDEQVLYCFLLDEGGEIVADVYILNNDESYLILSERIEDAELRELLENHRGDYEVDIVSLTHDKSIVCLDGPYSWELAKAHFGVDVVGIPFMGFLIDENDEETIVLRAGKSGEFCYKFITNHDRAADLWEESIDQGGRFNLCRGGIEIQNIARIENPYWLPLRFSATTRLPTELQMQWMVRYDKDDYVGKENLDKNRKEGINHRCVGIQVINNADHLADGLTVYHHETVIGTVMASVFSPTLGKFIGLAHLEAPYAYAGIDEYHVSADDASIPILTCGTPFFTNFSFMVNPNEHSYVDPTKHKHLLEQINEPVEDDEAGAVTDVSS